MATVRENLIAAKALIDTPEKWGRGQASYDRWRGEDFPLCAGGACARQAGRDLNRIDFARDTLAVLIEVLPKRFVSIASFNDDPATTHADIMALFDRAIATQDEDRLQTREQMLRGLAQ